MNPKLNTSILFVGNLVDVKAPERALAGFAAFAKTHPESRLNIVGEGPLRPTLVKQVEQLKLADRVTFHGRQAPEAVADMMRQAACLLLTSRSEGMPNVVIECLACGTPVVATGVGEVPFLIRNGQNGYWIDVGRQAKNDAPRIIEDLAEALARTMQQTWDRQAVAQTVKEFTWEAAARIVLEEVTPSPARK